MSYLLDTNHWSYLQEEHPQILAHLQQLPPETVLCMSVISQGELLAGVEWAQGLRRKAQLRLLYERAVATAAMIVPITEDIAEQYAKIYAQLRRKGRLIQSNDIWIAATALAYNMVLVSADAHFRLIEGLQVEDWTQP
ncbi:MAG: type II toxin-antitoxin system VapC family toxin [Armatimonadota bacterium]